MVGIKNKRWLIKKNILSLFLHLEAPIQMSVWRRLTLDQRSSINTLGRSVSYRRADKRNECYILKLANTSGSQVQDFIIDKHTPRYVLLWSYKGFSVSIIENWRERLFK